MSISPEHSRINQELSLTPYVTYSPVGYAPYLPHDKEIWRNTIIKDLSLLAKTWRGIITYGVSGPLAEIPKIASELGFQRVVLGIYDLSDGEELDKAIELARSYPEMIRVICLGNEGLLFERYDLGRLERVFATFRSALPGVLLTTSEPIFAWGERRLLDLVDFPSPIIHPWIHEIFRDDPMAAALWVIQAAQRLQILSNKPVLIKETGFPSNGREFPFAAQSSFWETLLREYGALTRNVHVAVFEAFDNPERLYFSARTEWDCHWGIFDQDRSPKPVHLVIKRYLTPSFPIVQSSEDLRVSVVIAAKDRPEFLPQAIGSVLAQREFLKNLILVDDNSRTDAVERICRSYLACPEVKFLRRTQPGSSGTARNEGLRLVESDLVCFLDDDDIFLPGKLAAQIEFLKNRPECTGVATGATVLDHQGVRVGKSGQPVYFPGAPTASMLAYCQFVHSSMMLRVPVLREQGGYYEFFKGEDWELWVRLLFAGYRLEQIDTSYVGYRRHHSNISDDLYLREATKNVLSRHLRHASACLATPLNYHPSSGELLRGAIFSLHAQYSDALDCLEGNQIPVARLVRFYCLRELGRYEEATSEIRGLNGFTELSDRVARRLDVHRNQFQARRHATRVGSAALLLEQRLLARDVTTAIAAPYFEPMLSLYFAPHPTNLNIEDGSVDITEELFFSRVTLTSC